jgi:DNA recombination protein RmuC
VDATSLVIGFFAGAVTIGFAVRWVLRGRLERERLAEDADHRVAVAELEAELRQADEAADAVVRRVHESQEAMVAQVRASCGEAYQGLGEQLVELATSKLGAVKAEATGELEARKLAVEALVKHLEERLTRVDETLATLDRNRRETHSELSGEVRRLVESQREQARETGALARALRQPHQRGRWGEMHLRRAVELAGMVEHCDFEEQVHLGDGETTLRPDMVVRLPGGHCVPIDAKAPIAPYLDAMEVEGQEGQAASVKLYARGLRVHAKKLAAKAYWTRIEPAPEFVLLYLPGDHFLGAALEVDGELLEDAAKSHVFFATPTTLMAMLRTVALAWQQERVAEDAHAIAAAGREVYQRLCGWLKHLTRVGRRLNSLVGAYNESVGSLERWVLPSARKLPLLGAVDSTDELPEPTPVERRARELQAPEAGRSNLPEEGKAAFSGDFADGGVPESGEGMEAA